MYPGPTFGTIDFADLLFFETSSKRQHTTFDRNGRPHGAVNTRQTANVVVATA